MTKHIEAINFFEAIETGWSITKKHWLFLLELSVLAMITLFCFNFFNTLFDYLTEQNMRWFALSFIYNIVAMGATWTIYHNLIRVNLDTFHGKRHQLAHLFELPSIQTWRYFIVNVIYYLMVFLGILLFVIPGIYISIRYYYAPLIVVDKNTGILDSFRMAAKIMHGEKWQMFAYLFVSFLMCLAIIVVGLICLIIGIFPAFFIAYWLFTFANLQVYKKLSHR